MNKDIYVVIEHLRGQVSDISYVMLAAARVLAQETGGNVIGVLLGHNAQGLAENLTRKCEHNTGCVRHILKGARGTCTGGSAKTSA